MKTVINLTPEKGNLRVDNVSNSCEFDLGNIKKGVPVTFSVLVENAEHKQTKYGCMSCTTGNSKQEGKNIRMNITYDAKQSGVFSKAVKEIFVDETQLTIKFKGKVV